MNRNALSLPILLSLVVGNMIGTGIYTLPASLAEFGSYSFIAWIVTSLGAIFFALTLTSLNKRYPQTGGLYIFCRQAYGRMSGCVVGYLYILGNTASIAGLTVGLIPYAGYLWPMFDSNSPQYSVHATLVLEIGIVWAFTVINAIGIHTAGVVQLFLTVIKLLPLIIISLFGLGYIHLSNITAPAMTTQPAFAAISSAAALTFWSYIGIESATIPAESTHGPRDIYKATVYGTLLSSAIYILCTFVLLGMFSAKALQSAPYPFASAGSLMFGPRSANIIALCAIISGLGALNVTIMIQGQILFAAARDRIFPHRFAKLSKQDVPVAGLILSAAIVSVLMILTLNKGVLDQFNNIILLASLFTLLAYLAAAASEIKFLVKDYGFKCQLFRNKEMWFAMIATIYCIWMISSFTQLFLVIGACSAVFFAVIYGLVFRQYRESE